MAFDRAPKSRLDRFAFAFKVALIRGCDSGAMLFQKFSQPLKCCPGSSSASSIGFEFVQELSNRSVRSRTKESVTNIEAPGNKTAKGLVLCLGIDRFL
jgi:hypothetical protein